MWAVGDSLTVYVENSIFWGNESNYGSQVYVDSDSGSIQYCDIEDGTDGLDLSGVSVGDGVIETDPLFVDATAGDYRVQSTSPCIDAGSNSLIPEDDADLDGNDDTTEPLPYDLAGTGRRTDRPEITDTGEGTSPIVDIGAYETPAVLTGSSFACEDSLSRVGRVPDPLPYERNVLRFTMSGTIIEPEAGEIEIRELLDSGEFGADLSEDFTFTVESDNVLRVGENGQVLENEKWYAVLNTGNWACSDAFQMNYPVVYGDADGGKFTNFADLSLINQNLVSNAEDDDRYDIDVSGAVNYADISLANDNIGSEATVNPPSEHACTLP